MSNGFTPPAPKLQSAIDKGGTMPLLDSGAANRLQDPEVPMLAKLLAVCLTTVLTVAPLSLPDPERFSFSPAETRTLPGRTRETGFTGDIAEADRIGRLGLVSLKYNNSSWIDGRYNHNDFPVEQGSVATTANNQRFDAYRIGEPLHKAAKFLGSRHGIYYRFPSKADWRVYQLGNGTIKQIAAVPADRIEPEQFTRIDGLTVSRLEGSVTYFFAPASAHISSYPLLNGTVEGARLATTPQAELLLYRHPSDAAPPDPRRTQPTLTRQFFMIRNNGGPGVIWQNKQTQTIHLTRFSADLRNSGSITLAVERPGRLLAACADPEGNLYYLLARPKDDPEKLELVKADKDGKLLARTAPDTSPAGLNIFSMGAEAAELAWSGNRLCLMLMHTMHKSGDGLNHQRGIAVIFNAADLKQLKSLGQTSGHSFDNFLLVNSTGEFIGMDLGDNFPRGIHLHKLSERGKASRVVYTFKTEHGTSPASRAGVSYPEYTEISKPERTFYKWSNDNRTYTELGGMVETARGYAVIFAGEPSPDGLVLDNSRSGSKSPDMRNIGFLLAVKQFDKIPVKSRNTVPDELLLSKGPAENGGFYSFQGGWTEQRSTGIIWLTRYSAEEGISARHIKAAPLPDGTILILWETAQKGKHHANWAMTITENGLPAIAPFRLPDQLPLNRRDAVMADGKRVYIAAGDAVDKKLEMYVLQFK